MNRTTLAAVGLTAALSSLTLAPAANATTQPPTTRHTVEPNISCAGFNLDAHDYDPAQANRYSWTLGTEHDANTFGATYHLALGVPQGGATTAWSYDFTDPAGQYHFHDSGTVGPCGTTPPPPPPPTVKKASIHTVVYCLPYGPRVEGKHNVKSFWWTHRLGAHPILRAIARHGALFANGKETLVRRLHQKHVGCSGHSSS